MTNQCYNVTDHLEPGCNMELNTKYKKCSKSDVPLQELDKELNKSLPDFKIHTYTKNQQLYWNIFKQLKTTC